MATMTGEESQYSIFLELRSPLVQGAPPLDLRFLGPSGLHGTLKVASRAIKPEKNAGLGVWELGVRVHPYSPYSPKVGLVTLFE